jgi:hypothetical protein
MQISVENASQPAVSPITSAANALTYNFTVPSAPTAPTITGVSWNSQTQTVVITGSGFGSQAAYSGDSGYLRLYDTNNQVAAGYLGGNEGDGIGLDVTSWSDNQIEIQGFTGAYGGNWVFNPGDTMQVFVENASQPAVSPITTAANAVTYSFTVPSSAPAITGVTWNSQTETVVITGSGFGSQAAYSGESGYLKVYDATNDVGAGYVGGNESDGIGLNVTSWSDNQIVIQGFTGAYGYNGWVFNPGDTIQIYVENANEAAVSPIDSASSALTYSLTVPGSAGSAGAAATTQESGSAGGASANNGALPYAGMVADAHGDLFGATYYGGADGVGALFEIPKTASGYGPETVLASFAAAGTNGENPNPNLIVDANGDLFGTTSGGAANGASTVFELPMTASGYGPLTSIANFYGTNGSAPNSLIADANGDLFGTTQSGGANGDGVVFEIPKTAAGFGAAVTLYTFTGGSDGANPSTLLEDASGDLIGTASNGGSNGVGTVFEIPKTASGYGAGFGLYSFASGAVGANPTSLITDANGDLFGATFNGGAYGYGTVFEIPNTPSGYGALVDLYTFTGGTDGSGPETLSFGANGALYGTASSGGANGGGTVFELTAFETPPAPVITGDFTDSSAATSAIAIVNGDDLVYGATDTATQTLTGTAQVGSTISLYNGSTLVASGITVSAEGAWSYQIGELADGPASFTATATNAVGTSSASSALNFDVATAAIMLTGSGSVSGLTNQTSVTFNGSATGAAVAGVEVYDNGAAIGAAAYSRGAWSYTASGLAAGANSFSVTAMTTTGIPWSTSLATVDVATQAPTVSASEQLSGLTAQTSDTLTVTAQAANFAGDAIAGVEIFDGSTDLGAATLSNGVWTYTATGLADGAHHFTAVATDSAGNTASAAFAELDVATQAPALNAAQSVQGLSNLTADTVVAAVQPEAVTGDAITGVEIYDGSTDLGAATLANGLWSYTATGLTDGVHQFSAVATDAAGNTGSVTLAAAIVATQTPTVSASQSVSGLTGQTLDTITVTASAETVGGNTIASVEIFDGSTDLGAATLLNGVWTYEDSSLVDGAHDFTAMAMDAAGNIGVAALAEVDVATHAPTVSASQSVFGLTAQTSDTMTVTAQAETVPGNAITGVEIYDGSTDLGAAALSNGVWTYTASGLADGAHDFTAVATDAVGNVGSTALAEVDVATQAPTMSASQSISGLANQSSDTITVTAQAETVASNTIVGVEIYDGSTDLGAATLSNGVWTYTASGLADGAHDLTAVATDSVGNTASAALAEVDLATQAPTVSASQSVSGVTAQTSDTVTVTAQAETVSDNAIAGVEIYDGTTDLGAATPLDGVWTYTASGLSLGAHSLSAVATDMAGNAATVPLSPVAVTVGSAVDIAALTQAAISQLKALGVTAISASDAGIALTFLQADAFIAAGISIQVPAGQSVSIADTAANIAALSASQAAALHTAGYETLTSTTGAVTVTLAQEAILAGASLRIAGASALVTDTIAAILALTTKQDSAIAGAGFSLQALDTAAHIEALTAAQIAKLASLHVTQIVATDAKVALTVAQALALETGGGIAVSAPAGDNVTIADTAAHIQSLTAAQIAKLAAVDVTQIAATDANVALSVAQATGLETAGIPVTAPAGHSVTISDSAAHLEALTAAQITGLASLHVTRIATTGASIVFTVAQVAALETAGLAVTGPTGYKVTVSDTAAQIEALTAPQIAGLASLQVTRISATGTNIVLTVAQAAALETAAIAVAGPAGGKVTIADTAAQIQTLTTGQIAALASLHVTQIAATDTSVALTVAQAVALETAGAAVSAPAGYTVTIADMAAQIQTLTAAQIAKLASALHLTRIAATDAAALLTVAQAIALESAGIAAAAPAGDYVAVADTAAHLQALTSAQIAKLASVDVTEIAATDTNVAVTVAQASALQTAGIAVAAPAGDNVTLSDSAAHLEALTAAQITGLASLHVTGIAVTGASILFTVTQTAALETAGISVTGPTGYKMTVSDSAAHLEALTAAQITGLASLHVTRIAATDAAVALTVAQAAALETGGIALAAPSGDNVTIADTAAHIRILTAAQIAALASLHVTQIAATDTNVALTVAQAAALETARAAVSAPAGDSVTIADTAAQIQTLTAAQIAKLVSSLHVTQIAATDADVALTVAQAGALESAGIAVAAPTGDTVTIADTAAHVQALTAAQIAKLATVDVTQIAATDANVALTVAQAAALETAGIAVTGPTGDTVTIADTAAHLEALTVAQISGLPAIGVHGLYSTNANVSYTAAQTAAILASGLSVSAVGADTVKEYFSNGTYLIYSQGVLVPQNAANGQAESTSFAGTVTDSAAASGLTASLVSPAAPQAGSVTSAISPAYSAYAAFAPDGTELASEAVSVNGGETTTQFFNAAGGQFAATIEQSLGGGSTELQDFNGSWQQTDATLTYSQGGGASLVEAFDGSWDFLGAVTTQVQGDATIVQDFGSAWQPLSASIVTSAGGGEIETQYFDGNWTQISATIVQHPSANQTVTQYFGADWNQISADILTVSGAQTIDQQFDGAWNLTGGTVTSAVGANEDLVQIYGPQWTVEVGQDRLIVYGQPGVESFADTPGLPTTFVFAPGDINGDAFSGFVTTAMDPSAHDVIAFDGYGPTASLTQIDASHWQISAQGHATEVFTLAASLNPAAGDVVFH